MAIVEDFTITFGTGDVCSLGTGPAEWELLRHQYEAELRPDSEFVVNQVALWSDHEVVDFGCGPTGVMDCLERVGPFGRVVGVDPDPGNVAVARSWRDQLGLANVTIERRQLADSGLEGSAFDLAHARLALHSSLDPAAIVREMVRVVRPGGWVVSAESDHICPRIPELFADAGLIDIGYDVRVEFGFFITWGRKR